MRPTRTAALLALLAASLYAAAAAPARILVAPGVLPPMKTVPVFGQTIAFYDVGTGPVVVLVHGFASQAMFDWGNVIMPLSRTHRVLALDQIGFGASAKPSIDYSIQTYVDFLGEFLHTEHVEHFALAGESLGGWISAAYTLQALSPTNTGPFALPQPDRLLLEDAAGHTPLGSSPIPIAGSLAEAAGVSFIFYDKSRVTQEFIRENFAIKLAADDGFTQRSLRSNPKVATELVSGKLDAITIPTLVVWGGDDPVVPLSDGRDFAAKIPHAELVIIPHCGHAPSLETPAEFLAAATPFLGASQ